MNQNQKMIRRIAVAVALAATLTGCGDGSEPAAGQSASASASASASSAAPSPSTPPVDGGAYASPLLLIDALGKGGITCANYTAVPAPTGALARGSCYVAAEEYTIGIYASAEDARAQPAMLVELLEGVSDVDLVLGQNWTVGCPSEEGCRQVASVLGGEVFHQDTL